MYVQYYMRIEYIYVHYTTVLYIDPEATDIYLQNVYVQIMRIFSTENQRQNIFIFFSKT